MVSGLTGQGTNYHLVPRVAQCPVLSRATAQSPQLRRPMSSLLRGWGKDLGLHHAQMLLVVPPASHFQRIQHTSSSPHSLSTFCPGFHHSLVYQSDTCPSLFSFPDFIAVAYCPLLFYCCCFMALKELSAILVGFQEGAVISEFNLPLHQKSDISLSYFVSRGLFSLLWKALPIIHASQGYSRNQTRYHL